MDQKTEVFYKDRIRNIRNIKQLLGEGMFPGKYSIPVIESQKFLEEFENEYMEKLFPDLPKTSNKKFKRKKK